MTQIKHQAKANCPEWEFDGQGAALHWYAEEDCVITSDGKKHTV